MSTCIFLYLAKTINKNKIYLYQILKFVFMFSNGFLTYLIIVTDILPNKTLNL